MNFESAITEAEVVELRVLHGPQAGSRLPLMPGAPYLIGAGDACDIMLAGAQVESEHAHIEVDGSHWTITPNGGRALRLDAQACDANQALTFGTVVLLGRVKLTVDHQDAEWPQDEALEPQPRPEPEPEPAPEAGAGESTTSSGAAADAPATDTPKQAKIPSLSRRRTAAVAIFVAIATASLALTAYAAWQVVQPVEPLPPVEAAPPVVVEAPVNPEERMRAWVQAQSAHARLLLDGGGEQPWRVLGHLKQDGDRQRLIDAARELPWPVEVSVLTEAERLVAVQRYTDQQASTATLAVRTLADGQVNPKVRVIAANQAQADEFIARLHRDLRPLEPIDTEVLLPPAVSLRFMERLNTTDLGQRFTVVRKEPDLHLTALLRQSDVRPWERLFSEFTREHGRVLGISAVVRLERDAIESRIRAVVAGAYPYVMTTSGQRVAPGGAIDGKTVVSVNAQEVVFSDGLRVRLRP